MIYMHLPAMYSPCLIVCVDPCDSVRPACPAHRELAAALALQHPSARPRHGQPGLPPWPEGPASQDPGRIWQNQNEYNEFDWNILELEQIQIHSIFGQVKFSSKSQM